MGSLLIVIVHAPQAASSYLCLERGMVCDRGSISVFLLHPQPSAIPAHLGHGVLGVLLLLSSQREHCQVELALLWRHIGLSVALVSLHLRQALWTPPVGMRLSSHAQTSICDLSQAGEGLVLLLQW